jgi:hypothetical protein
MGPELAVADGALGFWKALPEVWPKTREQATLAERPCFERVIPGASFPISPPRVPGSGQRHSRFDFTGISPQPKESLAIFRVQMVGCPRDLPEFPIFFPVSREFMAGDGFDHDCIRHHPFTLSGEIWRDARKARDARAFSMRDAHRRVSGGSKRRFGGFSLCRRNSRSWCRKAVMRDCFVPELSSARCRQIFEVREAMRSGTREPEPLKLQRPFGRRIAQGRNADAARQATPDGSLD